MKKSFFCLLYMIEIQKIYHSALVVRLTKESRQTIALLNNVGIVKRCFSSSSVYLTKQL